MKNPQSTTILLVDDHAIVRMGYGMLLKMHHIDNIIEAESGEQAYQLFSAHQPDIVIMDLSLPGVGGLATIRKIIKRDEDAKILVFSIHDEPIYIKRAMNNGAKGYITKSCAPELLLEALQQVLQNEIFIQPELAQRMVKQQLSENLLDSVTDKLSAREFEVFHLIAQGHTTQITGEKLNLSTKTIANYVSVIKNKLNVNTETELVHMAYDSGLFAKIQDFE
jgi:DNA-binding NarL/FixJ family response regulator